MYVLTDYHTENQKLVLPSEWVINKKGGKFVAGKGCRVIKDWSAEKREFRYRNQYSDFYFFWLRWLSGQRSENRPAHPEIDP